MNYEYTSPIPAPINPRSSKYITETYNNSIGIRIYYGHFIYLYIDTFITTIIRTEVKSYEYKTSPLEIISIIFIIC